MQNIPMKVWRSCLGAFHTRLRKNTRIIAKLLRPFGLKQLQKHANDQKLIDERSNINGLCYFFAQINNSIQAEKEYITPSFSSRASWQLPLACVAPQQLGLGGPYQRSHTAEHQKPLHQRFLDDRLLPAQEV